MDKKRNMVYNTGMRNTQKKGDIAVAQAIVDFTRLDMDVSLPITESAAYDIVVDDGESLRKVQVRFSKSKEVELRRIHSNSSGYVVKKTRKDAYDWLYVLRPTGEKYLIKKCYCNRRSVTPKAEDLLTI